MTPTTPEAGLDRFLALAEDELARFAAFPEIVALWRPRLARMGEWFVGFEADRAPGIAERILENRQVLRLPVAGVAFDLSGRADRIDRLANGTVAILDYKTGSLPSLRQVQSLLSPQLPLEALMLQEGAFGDDLATRTIAELLYVRLSGTRDGGETREVTAAPRGGAAITAAELAERVGAELHDLVLRYRDPRQGYASRPRVQGRRRLGGDYDHLARVKEWAAAKGATSRAGPRRAPSPTPSGSCSGWRATRRGRPGSPPMPAPGKTWVLSRRVMRQLLAGVPASRILCLTFTKAAAATMSNRVPSRNWHAGRWRKTGPSRPNWRRSPAARRRRRNASGRGGCSPRRSRRRAA